MGHPDYAEGAGSRPRRGQDLDGNFAGKPFRKPGAVETTLRELKHPGPKETSE